MNMALFNRKYKVTIKNNNDLIVINDLRISFISSQYLNAGNRTLSLAIYNMSKSIQDKLFSIGRAVGTNYTYITLDAGFQNGISTVFNGTIIECKIIDQETDIICSIYASTHYYENIKQITKTFDCPNYEARFLLIKEMGLTPGEISKPKQEAIRAITLVGSAYSQLRQLLDDDEYIIQTNGVIDIVRYTGMKKVTHNVNASTGLIRILEYTFENIYNETYSEIDRYRKIVKVKILLNPVITAKDGISLKSIKLPQLNGLYYISEISTQCDTHSVGTWVQVLKLVSLPPEKLNNGV